MKVRYGHVSNSSSSSFIVGVDKPLDSLESVREQIFHNAGANTNGYVSHEYSSYDPIHINVLCEQVLAQAQENMVRDDLGEDVPCPSTIEGIMNNLHIAQQIGWNEIYDERSLSKTHYDEFPKPKFNSEGDFVPSEAYTKASREHYDKWEAMAQKLGKEAIEKARPMFENKHIYFMTFADEDGHIGSHLEHGPHWNNVTHIRISNH
jgi:hypothetical protein